MAVRATFQISDVLLCEDHCFMQIGLEVALKKLLSASLSIRVTGSAKQALQAANERKPDLMFVDLGLPDMSGIDLIRTLKQTWPDLRIIVVTNCDQAATLRQAQRLGVAAIMQKVSSEDQLQEILEAVLSNGPMRMDSSTADILKHHIETEFTPREYEVLQEVIQGRSNRQIAEKLGCGLTTVRFHRANILEKTGIRNAAELTAWFLKGQRKRY